MPTKQRITNVVFLYIPVLRVSVLPVVHCKGSGSYSLVCPRPCSSTCRWARCATHRQKCSYAHFDRVSAAPCITAEGTGLFLKLARATGLDICTAPPHLGAFSDCLWQRVLGTAFLPRIFVLPRQAHIKMLHVLFATLDSRATVH